MRSGPWFGKLVGATAPIALAFVTLAAIEVSYFPGRDSNLHVAALRAKAIALAELTAHSVVPALEFEDEAVLVEFLSGVARDPDVSRVVACSSDGKVIRAAGRGAAHARCALAGETQVVLTSDELRVTTPIVAKTRPGILSISFRTEAIARARHEAERVALAIAAGILLLGGGVTWWITRILRRQQTLLEENRSARARAEAASDAKSAFLANMSHEIRTPMNGVIGMTQLLEQSALSDLQRRHVHTIARSGELLLALINDILDFSKVEAGKLTISRGAVDLRLAVADVCDSLRLAAQAKGLLLEEGVQADVPEIVSSDGVRLRQVLLNLASNAIKFTERGSVSVRVRRETADPKDQRIRFEVIDSGIGIAASDQASVFDAFTQVDGQSTRRYGGTGLGLTICKRLVSLMQGTIGLTSSAGQGSTFWFVLPLEATDQQTSVASRVQLEAEPAADQVAETRLLAVDDNDINRGVLEHLARQLGYQVEVVEGGREAVERVTAGQHYAVILMDCQMPDVDGYMATRDIRRWEKRTGNPRVPIVAVTAHVLNDEEDKVRQAGMDDYMSKPVRLNALRTMLEKWSRLPPAASLPAQRSRVTPSP
jgi:signal transduction histidine kinase/ActR/RegA family two-component response regulator